MESRLPIDTSVLKEKKQIGESLTDLNNLNLFTDDFNVIRHKKENDEYIAQQQLKEQCFTFSDMQDEEVMLTRKMFCSTQKAVSKVTPKQVDYGNYYMFFGSIFIGIVICCIVFGITDKKRGAGDNDVDINN